MVQVKYGETITEMKGKIAGYAFKGNYSAPAAQKIIRPRQQYTDFNAINKANLSYIAALWRQLTSGQRDDWNTLALTWPFINCFGDTYYGSGFQVFMSVNLNLSLVGIAYHTTAADKEADWELKNVWSTFDSESDGGQIGFDNIDNLGNWRVYFQSTMPMSKGIFHTPQRFHFLNYISSTGGPAYWIWQGSYSSRFYNPAYSLIDKKIVIRIKMININTGQTIPTFDQTQFCDPI